MLGFRVSCCVTVRASGWLCGDRHMMGRLGCVFRVLCSVVVTMLGWTITFVLLFVGALLMPWRCLTLNGCSGTACSDYSFRVRVPLASDRFSALGNVLGNRAMIRVA